MSYNLTPKNDSYFVAAELRNILQLALSENITEEDLLNLLAEKITAVIAQGPQAFYQLMYQVDIAEKKLNNVIGDSDIAYKIARLVYDRQLQKLQSRRNNKTAAHDNDPDLKW